MIEADELDPRWHGAVVDADHWHFHRRLLERYGIVLAPGEFSKLVAQIKEGSAQVIQRRARGLTIYVFEIGSADQPVFVMAKRTHLLTAMPPRAIFWRLRKKFRSA